MMQSQRSPAVLAVAIVIAAAVAAGLFAGYKRFHSESSNRRVEIAVEWQEITALAQASGRPTSSVLESIRQEHVATVLVAEDTITTLEQAGAVRPFRGSAAAPSPGAPLQITTVTVDTKSDIDRIATALRLRGLAAAEFTGAAPSGTHTVFQWREQEAPPAALPGGAARSERTRADSLRIATTADYPNLRTVGLGLAPEVVDAVRAAGMRIAGRIGNFAGVSTASAEAALHGLAAQGATTVIFSGDEILGYRNRSLEKAVAEMLRSGPEAPATATGSQGAAFPVYGAVEFGKQKGDEKLSVQLKGDYVRVHTIQAAEMGQMEEDEAIDRFVRAAKERNIRFCYVRLLTLAGPDPLGDNLAFLRRIAAGMARGSLLTGGDMGFGPARRYPETGVGTLLFALIALGAAAGAVWMLHALAIVPDRQQLALLAVLSVACVGAAIGLGEAGRKLVAFLIGVIYPTIACLVTYPGRDRMPSDDAAAGVAPKSPITSLVAALRALCLASAVTALGIAQVVGLLATRPFMLRANQFLGIKAQHAAPLLIIALIAIAGGVVPGDTWARFLERARRHVRTAMDEPARFGVLALGLIALVGLALVVARTGNDAGVGVSGVELKLRGMLDRILPVRPRTKEFLVGHPAFVLALAWWWRGRRRMAIPAFVVGSLGQVSLLNTFCHIHTPLIISVWRDGLGLLFGALIGALIFLALEAVFAAADRVGSGAAMRATPSGAAPDGVARQ